MSVIGYNSIQTSDITRIENQYVSTNISTLTSSVIWGEAIVNQARLNIANFLVGYFLTLQKFNSAKIYCFRTLNVIQPLFLMLFKTLAKILPISTSYVKQFWVSCLFINGIHSKIIRARYFSIRFNGMRTFPLNVEPFHFEPIIGSFLSRVNIIFRYCVMCYNVSTYKSPPVVMVALGEFESPRQLASGCQDRHVCQFHHSANESGEGDLAKDCPSPKLPQLISYYNLHYLSIGKTIAIVTNIDNKPELEVYYGCMS